MTGCGSLVALGCPRALRRLVLAGTAAAAWLLGSAWNPGCAAFGAEPEGGVPVRVEAHIRLGAWGQAHLELELLAEGAELERSHQAIEDWQRLGGHLKSRYPALTVEAFEGPSDERRGNWRGYRLVGNFPSLPDLARRLEAGGDVLPFALTVTRHRYGNPFLLKDDYVINLAEPSTPPLAGALSGGELSLAASGTLDGLAVWGVPRSEGVLSVTITEDDLHDVVPPHLVGPSLPAQGFTRPFRHTRLHLELIVSCAVFLISLAGLLAVRRRVTPGPGACPCGTPRVTGNRFCIECGRPYEPAASEPPAIEKETANE